MTISATFSGAGGAAEGLLGQLMTMNVGMVSFLKVHAFKSSVHSPSEGIA